MKRSIVLLCFMGLLVLCVGCGSGDEAVDIGTVSSQPISADVSSFPDETSSSNELVASIESVVTVPSNGSAQSASSVPSTSHYTATHEDSAASKPTSSASATKKIVTDAIYETVKDPYDGCVYTYHIPQINLSGGLADKINRVMRADGTDWLNEAKKAQAAGGSIIHDNYGYTWSHYSKVVSIVAAGQYPNDCKEYFVYNVSSASGKQLTNQELCQALGVSQQQVTNLIVKKAGEKFQTMYNGVNADPYYSEQYNKTITTTNANESMLYINQSGKLCSVTKIYSLAGADYYYHELTLG